MDARSGPMITVRVPADWSDFFYAWAFYTHELYDKATFNYNDFSTHLQMPLKAYVYACLYLATANSAPNQVGGPHRVPENRRIIAAVLREAKEAGITIDFYRTSMLFEGDDNREPLMKIATEMNNDWALQTFKNFQQNGTIPTSPLQSRAVSPDIKKVILDLNTRLRALESRLSLKQ